MTDSDSKCDEILRSVLLPVRHPHHELFVCDVLDAIPKDDLASMEHPVFSLATKPDTRILRYAQFGSCRASKDWRRSSTKTC